MSGTPFPGSPFGETVLKNRIAYGIINCTNKTKFVTIQLKKSFFLLDTGFLEKSLLHGKI